MEIYIFRTARIFSSFKSRQNGTELNRVGTFYSFVKHGIFFSTWLSATEREISTDIKGTYLHLQVEEEKKQIIIIIKAPMLN